MEESQLGSNLLYLARAGAHSLREGDSLAVKRPVVMKKKGRKTAGNRIGIISRKGDGRCPPRSGCMLPAVPPAPEYG